MASDNIDGVLIRMRADMRRDLNKAKEAIIKAAGDAAQEYNDFLQEKYKEIMKESTQAFYDDYSPVKYKRNFNLNKISDSLSIGLSGSGESFDMMVTIDTSCMTPKRNGDSLEEIVYQDGWHGGPMWFGHTPATQMDPPPSYKFEDDMNKRTEAEFQNEWKRLVLSHLKEALS